MRFWTWALEAYARPGAAEACIDLQDRFGQCIPYLLWAAWAAREGRPLDAEALQAGAELSERWEAVGVGPLRQARRAMKPSVAGIAEGAREAIRAEVKALELKAEQLLIETLEALAPEAAAQSLPIRAAVFAAARAWPSQAPQGSLPEALERLAQTLS
jgi:uncharacterized protein (TIGR02444 family)